MDPLEPDSSALCTDLSSVTVAAAWWEHGVTARGTFELSLRRLPSGRGYVVAAGLEQAIRYLLEFHFQPTQLVFLRNLFFLHNVRPAFYEYLAGLRFTGDLWAAPEGTPMFPGEPFLRVTAPLAEGQLFASYLTTLMAYQSLVATNTARVVDAAGDIPVVDAAVGAAPGPSSSVLAARGAYIGGSIGTTNLEAACQLGIPIHTAMAHSYVLASPDEDEAFRSYLAVFPNSAHLAIDTHDVIAASHLTGDLKPAPRGVRIDSEDTVAKLQAVRDVLDEAGLNSARITVSSNLDEKRIGEMVASGAPIGHLHVGSALSESGDVPRLELSYDLVEIFGDEARTAARRNVLPGTKQVYRKMGTDGLAKGDTIALVGETLTGAAMLEQILKDGKQLAHPPGLETIRSYARRAIATVPPAVRRLETPETYPVALSPALLERGAAGG